jgi:hypothetical protein
VAAVRRAGRPLPFADSWIAATALHLGLRSRLLMLYPICTLFLYIVEGRGG